MYLKRNDEWRVLGLYLGDYHRQLYLREISRTAKIPLKNAQNVLNALEQNNILKSALRGKHKYFRLNLENVQTKFALLQTEIYQTLVFLEKYPQFKMFLKNTLTDVPLIVFGGFAKGTADKNSDVDILIISKEEELPVYLLPHTIHEMRLSKGYFKRALEQQATLIKEIEANHIILNDHSFYINAAWRLYGK